MHRKQYGIVLAAGIAALVSLGCLRDEVDETADTLAVGGDVDLARGATVRVGDRRIATR